MAFPQGVSPSLSGVCLRLSGWCQPMTASAQPLLTLMHTNVSHDYYDVIVLERAWVRNGIIITLDTGFSVDSFSSSSNLEI